MTRLEKNILFYVLYTPRKKDQIFAHVNRRRFRKYSPLAFQEALDALEDGYIIEELGKEELAARRSGKPFSGAVSASEFSGVYVATDEIGVELGEELRQDMNRFIVPLALSFSVSLLSLILSAASLHRSLSQSLDIAELLRTLIP